MNAFFVKVVTVLMLLACCSTLAKADIVQKEFTMKVYRADTLLGEIKFILWPEVAPLHADFVEKRISEGFYNGSAFHRVIPGFMIQGGDPNSVSGPRNTWGTGGYPQKVKAEFNSKNHVRGVISAARTVDPNSFGGQFFICVATASHLDGQYSAFGEVIAGMDVVDVIVNAERDAANNPFEKIWMMIDNPVLTSVPPVSQQTLSLHPVPADNHVIVSLHSADLVTHLRVVGITGIEVDKVEWHQYPGSLEVDVRNLATGLYTLILETSKDIVTSPLQVVK